MITFRHSKNNFIWIAGIGFLLRDFLIDEPGYALPPGAIERTFDGTTEYLLTATEKIKGNNEAELSGYVSKINIYIAAKEARRLKSLGSKYADTLSNARIKKRGEMKRVAVTLFRRYEDSDLEISDANLQAYKSSLIAQKTTIAGEISALATIGAVAEYLYTGWPSPP